MIKPFVIVINDTALFLNKISLDSGLKKKNVYKTEQKFSFI